MCVSVCVCVWERESLQWDFFVDEIISAFNVWIRCKTSILETDFQGKFF